MIAWRLLLCCAWASGAGGRKRSSGGGRPFTVVRGVVGPGSDGGGGSGGSGSDSGVHCTPVCTVARRWGKEWPVLWGRDEPAGQFFLEVRPVRDSRRNRPQTTSQTVQKERRKRTARGSFHLRVDFSMSNELDQF